MHLKDNLIYTFYVVLKVQQKTYFKKQALNKLYVCFLFPQKDYGLGVGIKNAINIAKYTIKPLSK